MSNETFDVKTACQAQSKLIKENGYPYFAPSDGQCYDCRRNIYEQIDHGGHKTGISVESAGKSLVTGCPHCHHSYCD